MIHDTEYIHTGCINTWVWLPVSDATFMTNISALVT